MIQSIQKNEQKKDDKEALVGNMISVKKFELWKFLEVNLPEGLRRLKQFIKDERVD